MKSSNSADTRRTYYRIKYLTRHNAGAEINLRKSANSL